MGRLPTQSILGLSMMSFATLAGVTAAKSRSELAGMFGIMATVILAIAGAIVHGDSLDEEPGYRSFAMGFVGANVGCAGLWYGVDSTLWIDYFPVAVAPAFAGLVIGVLVHKGDVQAEKKRKEAEEKVKEAEEKEARRVKRMAGDTKKEETEAGWDKVEAAKGDVKTI